MRRTLLAVAAVTLFGAVGALPESVAGAQPSAPTATPVDDTFNPADFQPVSERDLRDIVAHPEVNQGRKVVVYGRIVDVLSVDTGIMARAYLAPTPGAVDDDYLNDSNEVLFASTNVHGQLSKVVEGDIAKISFQVIGKTVTYDTAFGGKATFPAMDAWDIQVTGFKP